MRMAEFVRQCGGFAEGKVAVSEGQLAEVPAELERGAPAFIVLTGHAQDPDAACVRRGNTLLIMQLMENLQRLVVIRKRLQELAFVKQQIATRGKYVGKSRAIIALPRIALERIE